MTQCNLKTEDVVQRWHRLFKGNLFSQRFVRGETLTSEEREALDTCVVEWRNRLVDISWFMRQINEHIAREANAEDNCTGRFNESHPWLSPFGLLKILKFKFFPEKFVGGQV